MMADGSIMRRVAEVRAGIHHDDYLPGHVRKTPRGTQHGTAACYSSGCHCGECKEAHATKKAAVARTQSRRVVTARAPRRIQRQRTKGWRCPPGAAYVGRPSLFGNPWRPSDGAAWNIPPAERAAWAVRMYQHEITHLGLLSDYSERAPRQYEIIRLSVVEAGSIGAYARRVLRGRDLACWCPILDEYGERYPCHADLLLEICNA